MFILICRVDICSGPQTLFSLFLWPPLSPPARVPAALGHSSMFKHEWNIAPWVGCQHSNDGLDFAHRKYRIISLRVNLEQGGNGSQKGGRQSKVFLFPSPMDYTKVQYLQAALPEKCQMLSEHSFWVTSGSLGSSLGGKSQVGRAAHRILSTPSLASFHFFSYTQYPGLASPN